jgi:hypothetical protein
MIRSTRHRIAWAPVEEPNDSTTDNLTIVLITYFEDHLLRPDDDPIDDETGWGVWAQEKAEKALDIITKELEDNG